MRENVRVKERNRERERGGGSDLYVLLYFYRCLYVRVCVSELVIE